MPLQIAYGAELRAREAEIRQKFDGLPIEELERRRACLVLVKRRFGCSFSLGAFQYLMVAIETAEEMIMASALDGDAVSEEMVVGIETHAQVDLQGQEDIARQFLGRDDDPELAAALDTAFPPASATQSDA